MPRHHVNELANDSVPREAAVGMLSDHSSIEDVVRSLEEGGIPADRLYFMEGEQGASLIEQSGSFISRLFETELRARPVAALRDGKTLLAVVGVDGDDAEAVRTCLADAGLENLHYFGRWTFS